MVSWPDRKSVNASSRTFTSVIAAPGSASSWARINIDSRSPQSSPLWRRSAIIRRMIASRCAWALCMRRTRDIGNLANKLRNGDPNGVNCEKTSSTASLISSASGRVSMLNNKLPMIAIVRHFISRIISISWPSCQLSQSRMM